jgi:hypothetical protein
MTRTETELEQAFAADGYDVTQKAVYQGKRGYLAEHGTARNSITHEPKRAIYVEGNGYQMGYLIGLLSEPEVRRMTVDYADAVIPSFISDSLDGLGRSLVMRMLVGLMTDWCEGVYAKYPSDIPQPLKDEMQGVADGCKAANSTTPVTYKRVLALNAGIDCIVSAIYTGLGLADRIEQVLTPAMGGIPIPRAHLPLLKPEHFRVPLACNAFAAFGNATQDHEFYFGRDFQFPSAGVYQDTACFIIYNPDYTLPNGQPALPLVSQAAPGFVGSVLAMNTAGVGIGVDMAPSGNCNDLRPGLNSLLMVRYAGYCGLSARSVVDTMAAAERGASWIYPVGDATSNRAVMIEAGMTTDNLKYLDYPSKELLGLLPKGPFLPSQQGLFPRWDNWAYPTDYLNYNHNLFKYMKYPWSPLEFTERGYINANFKVGLDDGYFFMPQRESKTDLVVAGNCFIVPEMRLCAMLDWTNVMAKSHEADIIWRYDELNRECLDAYGNIDAAKARELVDFLSPSRQFPDYYGDAQVIDGSVSLCNLTDRTITSHFGYHQDDWVSLDLKRYV